MKKVKISFEIDHVEEFIAEVVDPENEDEITDLIMDDIIKNVEVFNVKVEEVEG